MTTDNDTILSAHIQVAGALVPLRQRYSSIQAAADAIALRAKAGNVMQAGRTIATVRVEPDGTVHIRY